MGIPESDLGNGGELRLQLRVPLFRLILEVAKGVLKRTKHDMPAWRVGSDVETALGTDYSSLQTT
jgi:hypothetical protein